MVIAARRGGISSRSDATVAFRSDMSNWVRVALGAFVTVPKYYTTVEDDGCKTRKRFFLEKEAKTFANLGMRRLIGAQLNEQEFFGSFFQKRTATFAGLCLAAGRNLSIASNANPAQPKPPCAPAARR